MYDLKLNLKIKQMYCILFIIVQTHHSFQFSRTLTNSQDTQ